MKNIVEQLFSVKSVVQSQILILKPQDAIAFIDECEKLHYQIFGMDAFFIREEGIQPSSEDSLDFTAGYEPKVEPKDRYEFCRKFIAEKESKGLCFEIVCEPPVSKIP